MQIRTIGERALIVPDEAITQTESGLYIPEDAVQKPVTGRVYAIGGQVEELFVGDRVIFSKYGSVELEYEGVTYLAVNESGVYAILPDEHTA
jgi:chaperonin GroES